MQFGGNLQPSADVSTQSDETCFYFFKNRKRICIFPSPAIFQQIQLMIYKEMPAFCIGKFQKTADAQIPNL